ncbi:MAG: four helix bundle protein [Saprospiraceae bacterium]
MITNFKTLKVWQRARFFVKTIYSITKSFPKEEQFGLTFQLNRSAVSVPSNIAEGCGRGTTKDLSKFLDISIGSSCEAETQLYLAFDLNYIDKEKMIITTNEITEIRRMLIGYQKSIN